MVRHAAQVVIGEGGNTLVGEAGRFTHRLSQTGMDGAGQQSRRLTGRHGIPPLLQPMQHGALVPIGEKVQLADQTVAACGHPAGDVKDGRAADTVLGKEDLAPVFRNHLAAAQNTDARIGLHALEGAGIGGVGFKLHQRGVQRRAVVPQTFRQTVAVHDAAHLAAGRAACCQDHAPGSKGFAALGFRGKQPVLFAQACHRDAGVQGNAGLLQRKAQHIQYAAGHVAVRVDAAAVLGDGEQSQISETAQGARHIRILQGVIGKGHLLAVVMGGGYI